MSLSSLKKTLVGSPLASQDAHHQRLTKKRALAVFASDNLSSVAYATEAILYVLVLAGTQALKLALPISLAIVVLLALVVFSYRQTLHQYPGGGGAYIVAKKNLGVGWSLLAGAALLLDYVLTVAVSISAGVEAITSAFPFWHDHSVFLCLFLVAGITLANLRGVKESAAIFALPTYFFIFSIFAMMAVGAYKVFTNQYEPHTLPQFPIRHELDWFLILKAFSSGCAAMTGVEAVSDGVPAFRSPEAKNASITLTVMAFILGTMFIGITLLSQVYGIAPIPNETVLSQLARSILGNNGAYYSLQIATMAILIIAANTSYADFPRIASLLARDRFLPRQLASLGDRLVFSNGIILLGFFSSVLIILFNADTHALIPLYAVGVFLSFTLSQSGMVCHWLRERTTGWQKGVIINTVGAVLTFLVFLIFVLTKFMEGAWAVVLIVPTLIWLFRKINAHYLDVERQLTLSNTVPSSYSDKLHHTVILPLSGIHRGVLEALRYAETISSDIRAVYVEIDPAQTQALREQWKTWGRGVPLVVLKSPYRSIVGPILNYIDEVEGLNHHDMMTIIVPEFVPAKWWQQFLHNQTAIFMRAALLFRPGKVVTSVRYHLD
jgi:amino acid transporter